LHNNYIIKSNWIIILIIKKVTIYVRHTKKLKVTHTSLLVGFFHHNDLHIDLNPRLHWRSLHQGQRSNIVKVMSNMIGGWRWNVNHHILSWLTCLNQSWKIKIWRLKFRILLNHLHSMHSKKWYNTALYRI